MRRRANRVRYSAHPIEFFLSRFYSDIEMHNILFFQSARFEAPVSVNLQQSPAPQYIQSRMNNEHIFLQKWERGQRRPAPHPLTSCIVVPFFRHAVFIVFAPSRRWYLLLKSNHHVPKIPFQPGNQGYSCKFGPQLFVTGYSVDVKSSERTPDPNNQKQNNQKQTETVKGKEKKKH